MEAKIITTYAVSGKALTQTSALPITFEKDEPKHLESGVIDIYPEITYQTLEGFGGALTETVGYLYSTLTTENKKKFLEEYFGKDGHRYNFLRMHMDSCDFSLEEYQAVSDPIADPELLTFTIDRDRKYMIPLFRDIAAMSAEPLSVLLSPWSPPWQWKNPPEAPKNDAGIYGGFFGAEPVDYTKPQRNNGGSLRKEFYTPWAKYLAKYVKAYLEEGIPVTMMSLQNESIAATNWDSCVWTAAEQKEFLKDHLYPIFKAEGLIGKVGLYIWDHNKERVYEYARDIIDSETEKMLEGIAFHWYSGDHFEAVDITHRAFPDMSLMLSECCALHPPGTTGMLDAMLGSDTTVAEAEYLDAAAYAHDIIGNINHGMNRWIDWNLCVDKDGGPRHVAMGFGAPVCVNNDGTYRKLLTFDYIGHFSRYILPGSERTAFSRCDDRADITAARRKDGSIVLAALNRNASDLKYAIRINGRIIRIELPSKTLSTVVIPPLEK